MLRDIVTWDFHKDGPGVLGFHYKATSRKNLGITSNLQCAIYVNVMHKVAHDFNYSYTL